MTVYSRSIRPLRWQGRPNGTHRISVHSEYVFVERGVNADYVPHLVVNLKLEGTHWRVEVNAVEVLHDEDLTITLAAVTWLAALCRLADFDNYNISAK